MKNVRASSVNDLLTRTQIRTLKPSKFGLKGNRKALLTIQSYIYSIVDRSEEDFLSKGCCCNTPRKGCAVRNLNKFRTINVIFLVCIRLLTTK